MSARMLPCRDCGEGIVLARVPAGGVMRLEPFPDPAGRYRVDVLGRDLIVLAVGEPSSGKTKRYDKHTCVPAKKAVPRDGRPIQLTIGAGE